MQYTFLFSLFLNEEFIKILQRFADQLDIIDKFSSDSKFFKKKKKNHENLEYDYCIK